MLKVNQRFVTIALGCNYQAIEKYAMDITIGREQQTRKLSVNRDGKIQTVGNVNSVPMDVSRQHVSFHQLGDDKWELKNLNDNNVTYVNGVAVERKVVSEADKVELGNSHFLISWETIRGPKVETIDVSHLQKVWEEYESSQLKIKENDRKMQNIQRLSGILSSCGILFLFVDMGNLRFVLTGASILIAVIFFIRGFKSDSSVNVKLAALSKDFRKQYVCPKCGRFMGNEPYDILIQNGGCRHCKAKFKT